MRCSFIMTGLMLLATFGCDTGPKSGRGFTLPDGDVAEGKETFQRLNCQACHSVADIKQFVPEEGEPEIRIALGGEVTRIKTYGELVTSIINPSHHFARRLFPDEVQTEDGQSKMPIYNDTMTITELIDIVAFLQSHYELHVEPPTHYPQYY